MLNVQKKDPDLFVIVPLSNEKFESFCLQEHLFIHLLPLYHFHLKHGEKEEDDKAQAL